MSNGSFKRDTNRILGMVCATVIASVSLAGATVRDTGELVKAEVNSDTGLELSVLNEFSNVLLTGVRTGVLEGTYVKESLDLSMKLAEISSKQSEAAALQGAIAQEQKRIADEAAEAKRLEEERVRAEAEAKRIAEEEAAREAERLAAEEAERLAAEEAERQRQEALEYMEQTGENVPNWLDFCNSNFKAYMGYDAVTCVSSPQYQLLNSESAYTDANTGIRMVDNRYCVALGSYYASTIGQKVDLYLETGVVIPCILGDCKADCHTNWDTHQYCNSNGSVAEFIVDYSVFNYLKDASGTVNWCVGDCGSFNGRIMKIELVE